jgi:quinol monooxygenase YgiN
MLNKIDINRTGRFRTFHCDNSSAFLSLSRRRIIMPLRLVVTITAAPGKGAELAQIYKTRCLEAASEPGCQQYEIFQSAVDPDKLVLLERWADQASLDLHAKVQAARPPLPAGLRRVGGGEREDYTYHRTR